MRGSSARWVVFLFKDKKKKENCGTVPDLSSLEKKKNEGEWAEKKRLTVLSAHLALRVKVFLTSNLLRSLLGLKKSPKDVGIFVCVVREFKSLDFYG